MCNSLDHMKSISKRKQLFEGFVLVRLMLIELKGSANQDQFKTTFNRIKSLVKVLSSQAMGKLISADGYGLVNYSRATTKMDNYGYSN